MPGVFVYAAAFVAALAILVVIHELGHFLVARAFDVKKCSGLPLVLAKCCGYGGLEPTLRSRRCVLCPSAAMSRCLMKVRVRSTLARSTVLLIANPWDKGR
ncbi:MAG: site-2 protease family protein [Rhodocyclaceae bacterium]|nr:site-2 protease family protein [Rhodocyclaceae bacterium]